MSLVGAYGNWKNDLDKIVLHHKEILKLSSAPLIIYPLKPENEQLSADNIYGEYTEKLYDRGKELRGFFENPTLVQELVKMGLDMPEQISVYFDTSEMIEKLGRPLQIYDLIQPPHQRHQIYVVMNTYPNPAGERLFKNVQWMIIAVKKELSGLVIPPYLTLDKIMTWIPFSEHWKTEFLQDREAYLEQRTYKINGDIDYFWQYGDYYDEIEVGAFNGIDNFLDFGNNYNFGTNSFSFNIFLKPDISQGINQSIIRKGEDFKITMLDDNRIRIEINGNIYETLQPFFSNNEWIYLSLVCSKEESKISLYKNAQEISLSSNSLPSFNIQNSESFSIGKGEESGSDIYFYKGLMSNLRIYGKALSSEEILNDYENLKERNFISY